MTNSVVDEKTSERASNSKERDDKNVTDQIGGAMGRRERKEQSQRANFWLAFSSLCGKAKCSLVHPTNHSTRVSFYLPLRAAALNLCRAAGCSLQSLVTVLLSLTGACRVPACCQSCNLEVQVSVFQSSLGLVYDIILA